MSDAAAEANVAEPSVGGDPAAVFSKWCVYRMKLQQPRKHAEECASELKAIMQSNHWSCIPITVPSDSGGDDSTVQYLRIMDDVKYKSLSCADIDHVLNEFQPVCWPVSDVETQLVEPLFKAFKDKLQRKMTKVVISNAKERKKKHVPGEPIYTNPLEAPLEVRQKVEEWIKCLDRKRHLKRSYADVSDGPTTFLDAHRNQNVAIVENGVRHHYKVCVEQRNKTVSMKTVRNILDTAFRRYIRTEQWTEIQENRTPFEGVKEFMKEMIKQYVSEWQAAQPKSKTSRLVEQPHQ